MRCLPLRRWIIHTDVEWNEVPLQQKTESTTTTQKRNYRAGKTDVKMILRTFWIHETKRMAGVWSLSPADIATQVIVCIDPCHNTPLNTLFQKMFGSKCFIIATKMSCKESTTWAPGLPPSQTSLKSRLQPPLTVLTWMKLTEFQSNNNWINMFIYMLFHCTVLAHSVLTSLLCCHPLFPQAVIVNKNLFLKYLPV